MFSRQTREVKCSQGLVTDRRHRCPRQVVPTHGPEVHPARRKPTLAYTCPRTSSWCWHKLVLRMPWF